MKSKIIIPGGAGFIGKYVARFFHKKNYQVIILTRGKARIKNGINYLNWDGKSFGSWIEELEGAEMVLNLAGKSVDCRYNDENKKGILNSRVDSTSIIGKAIDNCIIPPKLWVNMSTATIYEHTLEGNANDEKDGIIGDDFSMNVAKAWEKTFNEFTLFATRKIAMRTSIVLGKEGGALTHLAPLVKFGLGGKNGSGQQFVSWIHVEDLARIIEWFMENKKASGIYNCTSPTPIRNKFFMKKIREAFGISFGLPASKWMIEIGTFFLRSESELVLKSRKVIPKKLLEEGFEFRFENLDKALKNINI
ncbi:MAG: TIGR01777 family oxidoreductase [Saprospiraceae bacterium]